MVRGDDFIHQFRIGGKEDEESATVYWDLTDWTLRGQVRRKENAEDVLAVMTVTALPDQDVDRGKFLVEIPDSDVDGGTVNFPRECVGDIEFVNPSGDVRTYFRIEFTVAFDATRVE